MVRRVPRPLATKDIEKKSKFDGAKSGRKKIQFIFYYAYAERTKQSCLVLSGLWYELSACPLLLNSNKVYFSSSLIARPILDAMDPFDSKLMTLTPRGGL